MTQNKFSIAFLGTGANGGTPQADCRCRFCTSKEKQNKRLRSSILVEFNNKKVIVDCGPDFRQQLTNNYLRLQDISFITLSHLHWDHCLGLVELSSGQKLNIPVVVPNELKQSLESHQLFSFLFNNGWAKLIPGDHNINFTKIDHDPNFPTFAIKITNNRKSVVIATDIARLNKRLIQEIKRSDLVIFDSTFLSESKHFHLSVVESCKILKTIAKKVVFTHVNHSENPKDINKHIKQFNFQLAFDGMKIKI